MANVLGLSSLRYLMWKRCSENVIKRYPILNSLQQVPLSSGPSTEVFTKNRGVNISDSCVHKLKKVAGESMLRVSVDGGGCSGFQYKFELDSTLNDEDRVFEQNGVKVVIDEVSLEYLDGATVDYHEELIRSAFRVVSNPKAEQGCSCGASFSVKL